MNQPDVPPASETQQSYPPFSGESPKCLKCGNEEGAYTSYIAYRVCDHLGEIVLGVEHNERLHRVCGRCRYAWDEAVIQ